MNEKTIEAAARAAHEANRAYCIALGDASQLPWDEAPEWQRTSCTNGARLVLTKDIGPRESHESWMREKRETGWFYGPVKDPEAKTHPCMLPYEQLPAEQRAKDSIFGAVVRAVGNAFAATPAQEST